MSVLSCTGDSPPPIPIAVRDSAGVRIVENSSSSWSAGDGWTLEAHPILEIGGLAGSTHRVFGVNGVQQLDQGAVIVVANHGTRELLFYDSTGDLQRRVGGRGQGPGEFQGIYTLARCAGDSLVVGGLNRISSFDAGGRFMRSSPVLPAAGDGFLEFQGVSQDCRRMLLRSESSRVLQSAATERVTHTLFWTQISGGSRDIVGTVRGVEVARGPDRNVVPVPWSHEATWALGRNHVYVGSSERLEIRVHDDAGRLERIVRWASKAKPVTATDRERYTMQRERLVRADPRARGVIRPLSELPEKSVKPAYSRLLVDDEENLWVREYPEAVAGLPHVFGRQRHDTPEEWTVFDSTGLMLGVVTLPADLEVQSIQNDLVAGVWKDELEVEYVRFYRIDKGAGQ